MPKRKLNESKEINKKIKSNSSLEGKKFINFIRYCK